MLDKLTVDKADRVKVRRAKDWQNEAGVAWCGMAGFGRTRQAWLGAVWQGL